MGSKSRDLLLAAGGITFSATALWFGTGLNPVWWVTWLATLPLLLVAPRLPGWLAVGAAVLAQLIGNLNTWEYLAFAPLPIHLVVIAIPAIVLGAGTGLFRRCVRRGALWQAWLSVPSLWLAFEYLYFVASPHGTFFSLAYTQMNCLPLIQLASLAGVWAVALCPLLFSSTVAVLCMRWSSTTTVSLIAGIAAVFYVFNFGFGAWRLGSRPAGNSLKVALIATDLPQNLGARSNADSLAVFTRYIEQVPALASQGAKLVVMPENMASYIDLSLSGDAADIDKLFSEEARRDGVFIVCGVDHAVSKTLLLNQARLYAPDGSVAAIYDKQHLLPGIEAPFTPGTRRTTLVQPSGVWGLAICKDMDFPALSRQYGNDGVGLLIVPAYDFGADGWLHGRMAVLRGIESGFSIARAAIQGLMTLTDDRGRIIAERASNAAAFATLVAEVPVSHDATLYDRCGDWFAWLNLALFAFLLATVTSGRGSTKPAAPESIAIKSIRADKEITRRSSV